MKKFDLEDEITLPTMQKSTYYSVPLGFKHEFYLSGTIEEPEKYAEWLHLIRNASENDEIIIHINSQGGNAATAIQLMRVLKETPATVTASVEGVCMSAATFIFLSATAFDISEFSDFMFHNYSSITSGKGGEMFDAISHEKKWADNLMKTIYKDFLTENEIQQILDNRDIWMEGDEVMERLKKRNEIFIEKMKAEETEKAVQVCQDAGLEVDKEAKPKRKKNDKI